MDKSVAAIGAENGAAGTARGADFRDTQGVVCEHSYHVLIRHVSKAGQRSLTDFMELIVSRDLLEEGSSIWSCSVEGETG